MPRRGVEPPRPLRAHEPESCASANSATGAGCGLQQRSKPGRNASTECYCQSTIQTTARSEKLGVPGTSFRRFLRSSQLRKPEDVRIRIRPARGRIPAMMRCSSGNDRHRRQIPLPERSHRRTGLRLNGCPIILMPSPGEFRQISSRNHDWRANTNEALHVGSRHLCSAMNSACNL